MARQDTHVGSYWISELLGTQNISVFFQFSGVCQGAPRDANGEAIRRLVAAGCACLHVPMAERKRAYCSGRCTRATSDCRAVVLMGQGWQNAAALSQGGTQLLTLERHNVVKHAVSQLKNRCAMGASNAGKALSNHVTAADLRHAIPTFLYVEPTLLHEQVCGIMHGGAASS